MDEETNVLEEVDASQASGFSNADEAKTAADKAAADAKAKTDQKARLLVAAEKGGAATAAQTSLEKQAGYYGRHPDQLAELNSLVGQKPPDKAAQALDEIQQLRLDGAMKDAVIDHGLKKEDLQFVTGTTPAEIATSAAAFAEYKKTLGGDADPTKDAVTQAPGQPIVYPSYTKAGVKATPEEEFMQGAPEFIKIDS